jgi:CHASE2 domain-containing sensor protein
MARLIKLLWLLALLRSLVPVAAQGAAWLFRRMPPAVGGWLRRRWSALSPFQRRLAVNLLLGLTITVLLHAFRDTATVGSVEDASLDWVMAMRSGDAPTAGLRPVLFLDIDEASYQAWGEPLLTPREKLARLIDFALAGGAAAIVVDVDLSRPGAGGEAALWRSLARYAAADRDSAAPLPPLVLARVTRARLPEHHDSLPTERPTAFDHLVAAAPGLHWGAVTFDQDADGKVRRWRLWDAACDAAGVALIRPSIQLQLKALLDANPAQCAALHDALALLTPVDCDDMALRAPGARGRALVVQLGTEPVHLEPERIARRIGYRLRWRPAPGEMPQTLLHGVQVPVLTVLSAARITDAVQPLDPGLARGHLVIIGASHAEGRDVYDTPLGLMPGALIVANAVLSLDSHGELRGPGLLATLAVETLLIVVLSLLFARFNGFWAGLGGGALVLFGLLPLSLWLIADGWWLNYAIPLLAIQAYQMAAELRENLAARRRRTSNHA